MALLVKTFARTVTTAGSRVQLSTTQLLTEAFTIIAKRANTGYIYSGYSDVSASNGVELAARDSNAKEGKPTNRGVIKQFDLSKVYIDSSVNGEGVIVEYLAEE